MTLNVVRGGVLVRGFVKGFMLLINVFVSGVTPKNQIILIFFP